MTLTKKLNIMWIGHIWSDPLYKVSIGLKPNGKLYHYCFVHLMPLLIVDRREMTGHRGEKDGKGWMTCNKDPNII